MECCQNMYWCHANSVLYLGYFLQGEDIAGLKLVTELFIMGDNHANALMSRVNIRPNILLCAL